jgi:hypothetical protein
VACASAAFVNRAKLVSESKAGRKTVKPGYVWLFALAFDFITKAEFFSACG